MKKIGILGGSFDPVHTGHVNLAKDALEQAGLDQVLLIPARLQPFKLDRTPASGEDRMEMLRLALAEEPCIEPCDFELHQEGVSYTYLTLRALQEQFGRQVKLYFIIGTDSLLKLETWMNAEELLSRYAYIVGSRPGYFDEELEQCRQDLISRYGTEIIWIHNRQFDISATELRQRLVKGEPTDGFIPPAVEAYIRRKGLYRSVSKEDSKGPEKKGAETSSDQPLQKAEYGIDERGLAFIKAHLKPSRFEHTLRVMEEAARLGDRFGADPAKTRTAAIFHDMAKNLPREDMNRLIRNFGLDEKYIDNPNLAHSKLAACLMRRDFGINDTQILDAVASHTTGRAGMSTLEKVIFLADAIEPGRNYPSVEAIRKLAEDDLDEACVMTLERTIAYLKMKDVPIDPDTRDALEDLLNKRKEEIENGRT